MRKVFLILFCIANLASAQNSTETFLLSADSNWYAVTVGYANAAFEFCWKRIPNGQEILFDAGIEAPIDLLFGDYTKSLGQNPAAKSVLRDTMKLPSAIAKAEAGTRVGGTDYIFDRSQVYSQVSKTVLKIGGTLTLVKVFHMSPKHAAIWANYPGDIVARYFVKAGQYRQSSNSTSSFEDYLVQESGPNWLLDTLLEVAPKILVCNFMGSLVERSQLGMTVRGGMIRMANRLAGTRIHAGETFWRNAQRKGPLSFLIMAVAYFAEKTVVTFVLAPPARIVMDGVALLSEHIQQLMPWMYSADKQEEL